MAKQAKKLPKLVRTPDVTFETPVFADPLGSGEVSALFVVVFGKAAGAARASVLGRGQLVKNELVLAEAETVEALRQGATPTSVGLGYGSVWVWLCTTAISARPASSASSSARW